MQSSDARLRDKLMRLQELVIDAYIDGLEEHDLHPRDFGPVVTLLNQNKITSEKDEGATQHQKVKKVLARTKKV